MPAYVKDPPRPRTESQCSVCKGLGLSVEIASSHNANTCPNKTTQTVLQGDRTLRRQINETPQGDNHIEVFASLQPPDLSTLESASAPFMDYLDFLKAATNSRVGSSRQIEEDDDAEDEGEDKEEGDEGEDKEEDNKEKEAIAAAGEEGEEGDIEKDDEGFNGDEDEFYRSDLEDEVSEEEILPQGGKHSVKPTTAEGPPAKRTKFSSQRDIKLKCMCGCNSSFERAQIIKCRGCGVVNLALIHTKSWKCLKCVV